MSKRTILGATNISLIIAVVVIVAIIIFIFGANTSDAPATTTDTASERVEETFTVTELPATEESTTEPAVIESEPEVAAESPTIIEEPVVVTEETPEEPVVTTAANGTYTDYSPELLANATDGSVVLFFHASWCPSCRALDKSINENFSDLPADVTILQLDFDTATELKKKYGVVRQHTLVQVDANGNEIKKITGLTNTLDQVLAKL